MKDFASTLASCFRGGGRKKNFQALQGCRGKKTCHGASSPYSLETVVVRTQTRNWVHSRWEERALRGFFYKVKICEWINSWPYEGVVRLQVGSSCYSEIVNVHTPSLSYCCTLSSAGSSRLLSLLESKQTSHLYEIWCDILHFSQFQLAASKRQAMFPRYHSYFSFFNPLKQ